MKRPRRRLKVRKKAVQHGRLYEYLGEKKTITGWGNDPRCQVSPAALRLRIRKQWDFVEAFTTPGKVKTSDELYEELLAQNAELEVLVKRKASEVLTDDELAGNILEVVHLLTDRKKELNNEWSRLHEWIKSRANEVLPNYEIDGKDVVEIVDKLVEKINNI